jgi:hypothetical protein
MTDASTSVESYKHRLAKLLLAEWLRDTASNGYDGGVGVSGSCCVDLDPIHCTTNRGKPYFGVLAEYPICLNQQNRFVGLHEVWDEGRVAGPEPPSYDKCIDMGLQPFVIFDLAVLHKGAVSDVIEVVHRNGIDETKMQKLRRLRPGIQQIWQVSAEWILCQVEPPERLSAMELVL